MKTLNLIACIFFGILSVLCFLLAIQEWKFEPAIIAIISGTISLVAYRDYKSPE